MQPSGSYSPTREFYSLMHTILVTSCVGGRIRIYMSGSALIVNFYNKLLFAQNLMSFVICVWFVLLCKTLCFSVVDCDRQPCMTKTYSRKHCLNLPSRQFRMNDVLDAIRTLVSRTLLLLEVWDQKNKLPCEEWWKKGPRIYSNFWHFKRHTLHKLTHSLSLKF